jgi:hypothetical protein
MRAAASPLGLRSLCQALGSARRGGWLLTFALLGAEEPSAGATRLNPPKGFAGAANAMPANGFAEAAVVAVGAGSGSPPARLTLTFLRLAISGSTGFHSPGLRSCSRQQQRASERPLGVSNHAMAPNAQATGRTGRTCSSSSSSSSLPICLPSARLLDEGCIESLGRSDILASYGGRGAAVK